MCRNLLSPTAMNVDELFTQEVMAPWHEECREAEFPWVATESLRGKWLRMATSQCATTSYVGAFALCRVTELTRDERMVVETFFYKYDGSVASHNATILAMLTGGSLAHAYCQISITDRLPSLTPETDPKKTIGLLGAICNYIRHPDSAKLPLGDIFTKDAIQAFWYAASANPLTPVPDAPANEWDLALSCFKSDKPLPNKASDFLVFAHLLRVSHPGEYIKRMLRLVPLQQPYASVIAAHPSLTKGPCPPFNHGNPSRAAIAYFASSMNPFCAVWRFYNPLLISPWILNVMDTKDNAGVIAGAALAGAMPKTWDDGKTDTFPDLSKRLREHPSHTLSAAFLKKNR